LLGVFAACCRLWPQIAQAQEAELHDPCLARVGTMCISEDEFRQRYELVPSEGHRRRNAVEESKAVLLYSLVAEKLLAQEALAGGLDEDSTYRNAMETIRKVLARDELYREEVRAKVSVSPKELRRGIENARRLLLVRYMYFDNRDDAEFVARLVGNRRPETVQIDSSIHCLQDTVTVSWGEAESSVEQAVFGLPVHRWSQVVEASTGYYLFFLDRETPNPFYTTMASGVLRERVESKLRLRKEEARMEAVASVILGRGTGRAVSAALKRLGHALTDLLSAVPSGERMGLTDSMVAALRDDCSGFRNDTLIVFQDTVWTVNDVLDRLSGTEFSVDRSHTIAIALQLNRQLKAWVQQEILAQEALRRKLDERYSVRRQLDMWSQNALAGMMERRIRESARLNETEFWGFLASTRPDVRLPIVRIRELHTAALDSMTRALDALRSGASFESVVRRWSTDSVTERQGGLSSPFSVQERAPIGAMAWEMEVGQQAGPVKLENGYVFFELIEKRLPGGLSRNDIDSMLATVRGEYVRMKQKQTVDAFIARAGKRYGVDIHEAEVRQLEVNPTPMMTFHILGFGGRIMAVPIVRKQVDWLFVPDPEKTPLP